MGRVRAIVAWVITGVGVSAPIAYVTLMESPTRAPQLPAAPPSESSAPAASEAPVAAAVPKPSLNGPGLEASAGSAAGPAQPSESAPQTREQALRAQRSPASTTAAEPDTPINASRDAVTLPSLIDDERGRRPARAAKPEAAPSLRSAEPRAAATAPQASAESTTQQLAADLASAQQALANLSTVEKMNRLSPWWNSWFFPDDKQKKPVPRLLAGKKYKYRLDLSRYLYKAATGQRVSPGVGKQLTDAISFGRPTVEFLIRARAVGRIRFFVKEDTEDSDPRKQPETPLKIAVGKLVLDDATAASDRRVWEQYASGRITLRDLSNTLSAGSIEYDVVASTESGCGFIVLSIWNKEGSIPLDGMSHAIPVGDGARCGVSDGVVSELQSFAGAGHTFELANLATSGVPDAALHVFEVTDDEEVRSIAYFVDRRPARSADQPEEHARATYYTWELASALSTYVRNILDVQVPALRESLTSNKPPADPYAPVANGLRKALFTARSGGPDGTRDQQHADAALGILQRVSRAQDGGSVYVRARDEKGSPVYLPLGLLAAKNPTPVLEKPITIVQPLPIERYGSRDTCISEWGYAIPTALARLETYPLPRKRQDARDPAIPSEWLQDWETLLKYLTKTNQLVKQGRSEGLVLLAHHQGNGYITWDDKTIDDAVANLRKFPNGSFGFLAACAMTNTKIGNDALLKHLNQQGVDTLILSPYPIDAEYGAALAVAFTQALSEARQAGAGADMRSITKVYTRARAIATEYFKEKNRPYVDEMSHEFIVLGDFGLKLCTQQ